MAQLFGLEGYTEATAMGAVDMPQRLPAGGYVCKILGTKIEEYQNGGTVIILRLEIAEGEQAGYFQKQYDAQYSEYKKWKGTYRLYVPKNKGDSEKYKKSLGFFKGQIETINKSNGCHIDPAQPWDTAILKDKLVGGLFGNVEWYMPENLGTTSGWYTKCQRLCTVDDIRTGNFVLPKDEPNQRKQQDERQAAAKPENPWEQTGVLSDDDIPF